MGPTQPLCPTEDFVFTCGSTIGKCKLQSKTAKLSKYPVLAHEYKLCRLCSVADETGNVCCCTALFMTWLAKKSLMLALLACTPPASGSLAKYVAACLAAHNSMLSNIVTDRTSCSLYRSVSRLHGVCASTYRPSAIVDASF